MKFFGWALVGLAAILIAAMLDLLVPALVVGFFLFAWWVFKPTVWTVAVLAAGLSFLWGIIDAPHWLHPLWGGVLLAGAAGLWLLKQPQRPADVPPSVPPDPPEPDDEPEPPPEPEPIPPEPEPIPPAPVPPFDPPIEVDEGDQVPSWLLNNTEDPPIGNQPPGQTNPAKKKTAGTRRKQGSRKPRPTQGDQPPKAGK